MLKNSFVILLIASMVTAKGKLFILNQPDALHFEQNTTAIQSADIVDIMAATLGYQNEGVANWSGLTINDPFQLPERAVILRLKGANFPLNETNFNASYAYEIEGTVTTNSLEDFLRKFRVSTEKVTKTVNVNALKVMLESKAFMNLKQQLKQCTAQAELAYKVLLESLEQLGFQIAELLADEPYVLISSLQLQPLVKSLSHEPKCLKTLLDLLELTMKQLQIVLEKTYFVVIADDDDELLAKRFKRDAAATAAPPTKKPAKIDHKAYSFHCPLSEKPHWIEGFHLLLWTSVTLAFTLLATSYVVATIDPGKDSIIYRVTSGKTKKDL